MAAHVSSGSFPGVDAHPGVPLALAHGQLGAMHDAGPTSPKGVIWKRSDHPFTGEGTQVSLAREPGYTPDDSLTVPFRFMFPPHENIDQTHAFNWATFDVYDPDEGVGQRSRPGGKQLIQVSFTALFMSYAPTWAVWEPDDPDPAAAALELKRLCDYGVRFRLRIRNPQLFKTDDTSLLAAFTQVQVTEQPGEPDARYVQCTIQEYKPTELERESVKNELGPWTHTITKGDTLYQLASRYYKRKSDWKLIAKANAGLGQQPPSSDLVAWSKKHRHKTLRIPASPLAKVPVPA